MTVALDVLIELEYTDVVEGRFGFHQWRSVCGVLRVVFLHLREEILHRGGDFKVVHGSEFTESLLPREDD